MPIKDYRYFPKLRLLVIRKESDYTRKLVYRMMRTQRGIRLIRKVVINVLSFIGISKKEILSAINTGKEEISSFSFDRIIGTYGNVNGIGKCVAVNLAAVSDKNRKISRIGMNLRTTYFHERFHMLSSLGSFESLAHLYGGSKFKGSILVKIKYAVLHYLHAWKCRPDRLFFEHAILAVFIAFICGALGRA